MKYISSPFFNIVVHEQRKTYDMCLKHWLLESGLRYVLILVTIFTHYIVVFTLIISLCFIFTEIRKFSLVCVVFNLGLLKVMVLISLMSIICG